VLIEIKDQTHYVRKFKAEKFSDFLRLIIVKTTYALKLIAISLLIVTCSSARKFVAGIRIVFESVLVVVYQSISYLAITTVY